MSEPLRIVTEELPPGRVGEPYSAFIEVTGGDGNYQFRILGGDMITKVTNPGDEPGVVVLIVTNPDGQSSEPIEVEYLGDAPDVVSVSPRQFPIDGGTTIVIDGTDIHPDAVVTIDGVELS